MLSASTASEALSLVRDEAPDLLISDIGLPEMDGYDLIQQVRRERAAARDSRHRAHRLRAVRRSHARAAGRLPGPHRQAGRARGAAGHDRQLRRAHRPAIDGRADARVSLSACFGSAPQFLPEVAALRPAGPAMLRSVNVRGCASPRSTSSQVHGADTGAPGFGAHRVGRGERGALTVAPRVHQDPPAAIRLAELERQLFRLALHQHRATESAKVDDAPNVAPASSRVTM